MTLHGQVINDMQRMRDKERKGFYEGQVVIASQHDEHVYVCIEEFRYNLFTGTLCALCQVDDEGHLTLYDLELLRPAPYTKAEMKRRLHVIRGGKQ